MTRIREEDLAYCARTLAVKLLFMCQIVYVWSDFLPSAMELDRVQFSHHFSLLCTWMILPKCSVKKVSMLCYMPMTFY